VVLGQARRGVGAGADVGEQGPERALGDEHHRRVDDVLRGRAGMRVREQLGERHDRRDMVGGSPAQRGEIDRGDVDRPAAEGRLDVEHRLDPPLVADLCGDRPRL
jgi:hypothetical protein